MDIPIGEYWLSNDPLNFTISRPPEKDKRGVKSYPQCTYYASLAQALDGLFKRRLCQSDATTLVELQTELTAIKTELNAVFDETITKSITEDTDEPTINRPITPTKRNMANT